MPRSTVRARMRSCLRGDHLVQILLTYTRASQVELTLEMERHEPDETFDPKNRAESMTS